MPITMNDAFSRAVAHVARHGDTDIFPIPVEKYLFFDRSVEIVTLLEKMFNDFRGMRHEERNRTIITSVTSDSLLATAGYSGFRWATQIDPLWNAYLLGLVIAIAEDIERLRIPQERNQVFSYRAKWDPTEFHLFDRSIGWREFNAASIEVAKSCKYVVSCDIADFYPRLYHHTLENELARCSSNELVTSQIMAIVRGWSKNVSYGLPVGGDAARLLSELVINTMDKRLAAAGVAFHRFVDDYRIFATSQEQAYSRWVALADQLLRVEGLQLQKNKTLIEPSEEFVRRTQASQGTVEDDSKPPSDVARFLSLRVHFDPYSETATEDYAALKESISHHDIAGMLKRETQKTRVDQTLVKRLLRAIRFLDTAQLAPALLSLYDSVESLYPLFPVLMQVTRDLMQDLSRTEREQVLKRIRDLVNTGSYITQVPVNLLHAIRVLALDTSMDADFTLQQAFERNNNQAIRRDCILAAARRRTTPWLKEVKLSVSSRGPWEQRAFLMASYFMGDEGQFWRKAFQSNADAFEKIVMQWMQSKFAGGAQWELPL